MPVTDRRTKKVLAVFGTRSDAVKMCPLILELKARKGLQTVVCVTGQHRQMLDEVLGIFGVKPEYDLSLMRDRQSLTELTSAILDGVGKILEKERPELVLVHGDTTTAFAASLACFYHKIAVGHVEAGLRSFDISCPFPEEFNRRAIDGIASFCFAPTMSAKRNLLAEGITPSRVFVTGNTAVDAMRLIGQSDKSVCPVHLRNQRLIFMTAHRRESIGQPMREIFRAVRCTVEKHPDVVVLYPVHPNPAVSAIAREEFGNTERVILTSPLPLSACYRAENECFLCLTDSGGVQEECSILGKPVLVMRDKTERWDGRENGGVRLVGSDAARIEAELTRLLDDPDEYEAAAGNTVRFGDGYASKRIADLIENGSCEEYRE